MLLLYDLLFTFWFLEARSVIPFRTIPGTNSVSILVQIIGGVGTVPDNSHATKQDLIDLFSHQL
jgi:hypothetical protein